MSAYESSLSVLRSSSLTAVSPFSDVAEPPVEGGLVECSGGCIRGILWALLIEGVGALALGWAVHLLRALHS